MCRRVTSKLTCELHYLTFRPQQVLQAPLDKVSPMEIAREHTSPSIDSSSRKWDTAHLLDDFPGLGVPLVGLGQRGLAVASPDVLGPLLHQRLQVSAVSIKQL